MRRVLGVLLLLLLAVRMCLGPAKRLQPAAALRTTPAELTQLVNNCDPIAGVWALKTHELRSHAPLRAALGECAFPRITVRE